MPALPIAEFPLRGDWHDDYARRDEQPVLPGPLRYRPLGDKEIRQLILYPGDDTAPIQCALYSLSLEHAATKYVALSYLWGDPSATERIFVDNHEFQATSNLAAALRHIRRNLKEEQTAVLWVDAVCINQADVEERSAQVRMMRDIYGTAALILCWLGEDGEQGLSYLKELVDSTLDLHETQASPNSQPNRNGLLPSLVRERYPAIRDAVKAFQNGYWRRVWTTLEYSAPVPGILMCGSVWISRDVFATAALLYKQDLQHLGHMMDQTDGESSFTAHTLWAVDKVLHDQKIIGLQRQRAADGGEESQEGVRRFAFLSLLQRFRDHGANDPKDRIYAPLSLAFDEPEAVMPIDYSKPVQQVYTDVARYCLADRDWPLSILELCRYGLSPDLPSWVPDWRVLPRKILSRNGTTGEQLFYASKHCFPHDDGPVWEALPSGVLRLHGHLLDSVGKTWAPVFSEDVAHGRFEGWLVDDGEIYQPTGERRLCAYRTTVGITAEEDDCLLDHDEIHRVDEDMVELIPRSEWKNTPELVPRLNRRRLARTARGFVGIVPAEVDVGDEIWLLRGGNMLYVLRTRGSDHALVGEAYLHGLMHGEISETFDLPAQFVQVTIR
ncbi:Heterokaryon incompatibility protein [Pleurostoma richardsiae]|uniref:Heterokaryon incompatibility protein n=1 Tax=Pleurostoma richardsiae TaxID=41990 RepID=A0AA38R0W4_9PEZI|nr:Heterokaryon incompatibility protein [Pleurostoma richardsiae]